MDLPAPSLVSVVVCTYSEARWPQLVQSLGSVTRQTMPPAEVVLVVDYNPGLEEAARAEFPTATVVANAEGRGLSGARNTGARAARGDIVVFLDDDAWAEADWLEQLIDAFRSPAVIGAGGAAMPAWERGRPGWFPEEFYWVVGCSYRGLPERRGSVRNPLGCNMAFRRAAFEVAGGFRSDFGRVGTRPIGVEETEFSVRVRSTLPAADILYVPDAVVRHTVPAQRATWAYFIRRCYGEGLSKAHLRRVAGARGALSAEGGYLASVIPSGIIRNLVGLRLRRSMALIAGVFITLYGFVIGTITNRSLDA